MSLLLKMTRTEPRLSECGLSHLCMDPLLIIFSSLGISQTTWHEDGVAMNTTEKPCSEAFFANSSGLKHGGILLQYGGSQYSRHPRILIGVPLGICWHKFHKAKAHYVHAQETASQLGVVLTWKHWWRLLGRQFIRRHLRIFFLLFPHPH